MEAKHVCVQRKKNLAKIQQERKMYQLPSETQTLSHFLYTLIQQSLKLSEKSYCPYLIVTETEAPLNSGPCPTSADLG